MWLTHKSEGGEYQETTGRVQLMQYLENNVKPKSNGLSSSKIWEDYIDSEAK